MINNDNQILISFYEKSWLIFYLSIEHSNKVLLKPVVDMILLEHRG